MVTNDQHNLLVFHEVGLMEFVLTNDRHSLTSFVTWWGLKISVNIYSEDELLVCLDKKTNDI